jgi:hypothetical protein
MGDQQKSCCQKRSRGQRESVQQPEYHCGLTLQTGGSAGCLSADLKISAGSVVADIAKPRIDMCLEVYAPAMDSPAWSSLAGCCRVHISKDVVGCRRYEVCLGFDPTKSP